MNCLDSLDQIFSFIDGQIDDKEMLEEIEEHLQFCRRCYDIVQFEKKVQGFIKECVDCEEIPDAVCCRAKDMLKKFREY